MLQWFIRFPEFAEFTGFLFDLGKAPLLEKYNGRDRDFPMMNIIKLKCLKWIFLPPKLGYVPRNVQYKDTDRRTIEIAQRAHILQFNSCLNIHNAHFKSATPIPIS